MFVRWKSKQLKHPDGHGKGTRSLYAVLVQCNRVDGVPRQQVIKHLAHIYEPSLRDRAQQESFWKRADRSLESTQYLE